MQLRLKHFCDLSDGVHRVEARLNGREAVVLNQVLIQQVLDPTLNQLSGVKNQRVELLQLLHIAFKACLEHLTGEELDVDEGRHHIVGEGRLERLHQVNSLPLFLQF